jgi:predicted  nucleic acid-binding Zn-ribbon protein
MSPFADPRKERDRLNALTAKMTREKKKQQFLSAQDQIVQLKTMNSKLMKQAKLERTKLAAAQKEIKKLRLMICTPP